MTSGENISPIQIYKDVVALCMRSKPQSHVFPYPDLEGFSCLPVYSVICTSFLLFSRWGMNLFFSTAFSSWSLGK
ncbi:hypothetical protein GDO81_028372 [Engystomops pustulosus]|uniref:Uncharacterized protein n=1 Tax=Engystomops pustulosus TaxID=76066 RepID=A0AAV6ZDZ1_ENGPU|nr:hypothetical protein GDO81_028372 [Engystomops pustulosus]